MTLAIILLVSISCAASPPENAVAVHQSTQQPVPGDRPASAKGTQDHGAAAPGQDSSTAPKPTPSTTAPAQISSSQNHPAAHKRRRHKRKVIASNCISSPAAGVGSATAGSATSGSAPQDAASPAKNCPPSKVIVRQGGTAEPSIQLAGGAAGDQAAQQRHTANQMLGATEANLKTIAGRQLTANQQDIVNQVRQFMEQSKSAVAAGDPERGRTLAWKAQLLSEELVNPQK